MTRAAILAVDDTPANLLALKAIIGSLGHEFVGASSGFDALAAVEQREFAVILLDVMMPVLDGLGTLERLRALPGGFTTPVIFLTAHDLDPSTMQRAYGLGALDYLVKPVAPEILRAKISSFIALYERDLEIRRQTEQLKLKDRYIAVLAHDLRNPLATISLGATQLARSEDERVRKVGERIGRAAGRMVRLTEDLLESARAAASSATLQRVTTDLSALCRESLEEFETTYPEVRFAALIDPAVCGSWDPARLTQALANLLTNAVKYGSGWVSLQLSGAGSSATLVVENGGTPIPSEQLERIFEPFVQAGRRERESGVGLGLYIVREIARGHGGDVHAISDTHRTRFVMQLPLHGAADAAG